MPLDEQSRSIVGAYREYIEDYVGTDDRYGPATRHDAQDESALITRFEAAPSCWFEVALRTSKPQIRVGFVTANQSVDEEIQQAIQESGDTIEAFVGSAFQEAGLEWAAPPVERSRNEAGGCAYSTPLDVDELMDLESEELRDKTLRMLEGYLLAFGPAVVVEDEE